jgi:hypothetical protein
MVLNIVTIIVLYFGLYFGAIFVTIIVAFFGAFFSYDTCLRRKNNSQSGIVLKNVLIIVTIFGTISVY